MLFTRCPECDTTFRVTDETLKKASGQVRCGRCASVFNAYAELHDPTARTFEPEPAPAPQPDAASRAAAPPPGPAAAAPPPSTAAPSLPQSPAAAPPTPTTAPPQPPSESAAPPPSPSSAPPKPSATEPAAQAEPPDAAAQPATSAAEPAPAAPPAETAQPAQAISATEVDRVLASDDLPLPQTEYAWQRSAEPKAQRASSRWWSVAAVLALLALSAQAIHHFRADMAGHATFGPWITATYAALGAEIAPRWNVHQYEILDWVATAEPNARGVGSLKITARIQNRAQQRQPYPAVQLRLKDRWEAAVGSRMFAPEEYLPRDTPSGRMMSPGETARAEIEVVDPGPDAYGFELDVCIEVEASLVTCGGDEVFL